MPRDPFAVTQYVIEDLPQSPAMERPDFGTSGRDGFGAAWMRHLGGIDAATRFVRRCYPRFGKHSRVSGAALQERNLALVTIIELADRIVPLGLVLYVLPVALDVEAKESARRSAMTREGTLHYLRVADAGEMDLERGPTPIQMLRARGPISATTAVSVAAYISGASLSKTWDEQRIPSVKARASARSESRRPPHPADRWFSDNVQDRVAKKLANEALRTSENVVPVCLRWDLLNLIEGYSYRKLPLPSAAIVALDAALDLLDRHGRARGDLPLAGIVHRERFMSLAKARVERPDAPLTALLADDLETDVTQARRWLRTPIFRSALASLTN